MHVRQFVLSATVSGLVFVSIQASFGQAINSISIEGVSMGTCVMLTTSVAETGEPFTGIAKTTCVQKLADGTTITHGSAAKIARDATGRTYRAILNPQSTATKGLTHAFFAEVKDPVNRVTILLDSNFRQAQVTHVADPGPVPQPPARSAATPAVKAPKPAATLPPVHLPEGKYLGIRSIDGLDAQGELETRVIPPGMEGNDQPITITRETWYSTYLNATLLQIDADPHFGVTTMELTGIELGPPDPALFQVPEGYTVQNADPQQPN